MTAAKVAADRANKKVKEKEKVSKSNNRSR